MYLMLAVLAILQARGGGGGGGGAAAGGAANAIQLIIQLVVAVLQIAGMWKAFDKAGKPGWAAIIPCYNVIVLCEVAGKEWWWFFIYICVPIVGPLLVNISVAEKFGQGAGFGVGLTCLPFIFYPILGFGSSVYEGGRRRRRREYEEEEEEDEDRPRRRRPRDEEEEDEDRPRRRPRDEDDEDDEDDRRIRRRPRDDD
jgi:hypothetical protein